MEENRIFAVVTSDTECNQITSSKVFKTEEEARQEVYNWYDNTKEEYERDGVPYKGECFKCAIGAYAWIEHDGTIEFCEAFSLKV